MDEITPTADQLPYLAAGQIEQPLRHRDGQRVVHEIEFRPYHVRGWIRVACTTHSHSKIVMTGKLSPKAAALHEARECIAYTRMQNTRTAH